MDAIAIAALILVIFALIKLLIVSFNAKAWLKVVKFIYSNAVVTFVIELILAVILFYYLLQSGLTIVPIMAVVALGALLTGMTMAAYGKETISWGEKILKGNVIWKKGWLPLLIWLALIIWAIIRFVLLFFLLSK